MIETELDQDVETERLTQVVRYVPETCRHCQAALPAQPGPDDPPPSWHQTAELPPLLAQVTEYQGHSRRCPRAGPRLWATNAAATPERWYWRSQR